MAIKILRITEAQLDRQLNLFRGQILAKAESVETRPPIRAKAETINGARTVGSLHAFGLQGSLTQREAGKLAHGTVRHNIRLVAACAAVKKWMQQTGKSARFHYAYRNERFQQFGDAEVQKADRSTNTIYVKAMWNSTGKNTQPEYEEFTFTWNEWLKQMDLMRPLATKKNGQGQPCHRTF